ncbi:MAG TPA: hypothetical protein VHK47_15355 [Polyangia bacterium]|nr:hypothetical protein [Polyangia bacterium]
MQRSLRAAAAVFAVVLAVFAATLCASCSKKPRASSAPPVASAAPGAVVAPTAGERSASCLECEMRASHNPTGCPNTSPTANVGTNDPAKFGCDGFAPAERARCKALLACLKAKRCAKGEDPTPCLCGPMDPQTCASKPVRSLPGACRDEYVAAIAGADIYTLFFSTDSPVGVANNLFACDVATPCTCP